MTTVTIQKTAKWIKVLQALGWGIMMLSVYWFFTRRAEDGGFIFPIGVVLVIFARMARWWNHG